MNDQKFNINSMIIEESGKYYFTAPNTCFNPFFFVKKPRKNIILQIVYITNII